jgi:hypothetical protein
MSIRQAKREPETGIPGSQRQSLVLVDEADQLQDQKGDYKPCHRGPLPDRMARTNRRPVFGYSLTGRVRISGVAVVHEDNSLTDWQTATVVSSLRQKMRQSTQRGDPCAIRRLLSARMRRRLRHALGKRVGAELAIAGPRRGYRNLILDMNI